MKKYNRYHIVSCCMQKLLTVIVVYLLCSELSYCQQVIRGRIINAAKQAVAGASVFISNTSKGTVSDAAGDFVLADVPAGTHELVTSSIGYETFVKSFSNSQLPLQLTITLQLKVKELEGVTVTPFEKDGWQKWGKLFLENFIGTTENAGECKITNVQTIRFRFVKKENKLTAIATEPLIIVNRALGYKIHYQLEEFQIDYTHNSMMYLGYPYFEEQGSKKRWKKAREKSYRGSVMNFIRALNTNQLLQQGFEVKRLRKETNVEKKRVQAFFKPIQQKKLDKQTGVETQTVDYPYDLFAPDSVAYYQKLLRQRDSYDVYGESLLNADSLISYDEQGTRYLLFADYLSVTYLRGLEEQKYLNYTMEYNRKPSYQRSSALLTAAVMIEQNGNYYSPQDFFSLGYWGWHEKIANMLPFDYEPGP